MFLAFQHPFGSKIILYLSIFEIHWRPFVLSVKLFIFLYFNSSIRIMNDGAKSQYAKLDIWQIVICIIFAYFDIGETDSILVHFECLICHVFCSAVNTDAASANIIQAYLPFSIFYIHITIISLQGPLYFSAPSFSQPNYKHNVLLIYFLYLSSLPYSSKYLPMFSAFSIMFIFCYFRNMET